MKKVLILGGTGAMGVYLVELLAMNSEYMITVTSRTEHESKENVSFVCGDAKNNDFLEVLLKNHWDVIVDFMSYTTKEFSNRVELLLNSTDQYIFISSARVYADYPNEKIREDFPRILDVCQDEEYLKTDEYALAKARQENCLHQVGGNWTIIRPSITYSNKRLQLGVLEKENWVYRALKGRTIVFSEDIADKYTTMSTGEDVAKGIQAIMGKEDALGKAFHIVSPYAYKWKEILDIYLPVLEEYTGRKIEVKWTRKATNLQFESLKYQVKYGRYFSRHFDNSEISKYVDTNQFEDPVIGLNRCLREFLELQDFKTINWRIEAVNDRVTGEKTCLSEISSLKMKMQYLKFRYHLYL